MNNSYTTGIRIPAGVLVLFCTLLTINVGAAVITVGPSGCNYTTIQAAIGNASAGDNIQVMSATYTGSLLVDRPVNITGIDTGTGNPHLNFMGAVIGINISAPGVTVERFSLKNASGNAVYIGNDNASILRCSIHHFPVLDFNNTAINALFVRNTTVSGNTINCEMGIMFLNCSRTKVEDNWIQNNAGYTIRMYHENQGVYIHYPDLIIRNNTVRAKQAYAIIVHSNNDYSILDNAIIEKNTIYNSWYPLLFSARSGNALLSNNTLYNHPDEPSHEANIGVYMYGADNCTVKDHVIEGFNGNTIIRLTSCSGAIVTGNRIKDNFYIGIYFEGLTSSTVADNIMDRNQYQFGFQGTPADLPGNTIGETNLVNGRPLIYREGIDGLTINSSTNAGAVYLIGCDNAVIRDLVISDEVLGIALIQSENGLIANNTVTGSMYGIGSYLDQRTTIEENTLDQCGTGLDFENLGDSHVCCNTITNAGEGGEGIALQGAFDSTEVRENTMMDTGNVGIVTSGVTGSSFEIGHNVIENYAVAGIALEDSKWVNVSDNVIRNIDMDGTAGIELGKTYESVISGNTIGDMATGLRITASTDNLFRDNTIGPAALGIGLYKNFYEEYSENNTFYNNFVNATDAVNGTDPDPTGAGSGSATLHSWGVQEGVRIKKYSGYKVEPVVQQSYRHINPSVPRDHLTSVRSVVGAPNFWNLTKTAGTNIVGGRFLGGNYWANPDGTGWSQTHADRGDGFCNASYVIDEDNTDYLPLYRFTRPPGDYSTIGVYRNGMYYLRNTNSAGEADREFAYGSTGDIPVTGHWEGLGTDTIGVYSNGVYYLRNSNSAGPANRVFAYGATGDTPVTGDWDGDGSTTIGTYRNGMYYLRFSNSAGNAELTFAYGIPGDIPVTGDWDGEGITTIGTYRNGMFYLRNMNSAGPADLSFTYGTAGDTPVTGDWNGDSISTIGVYRNGVFYLRNTNSAGPADLSFAYGSAGDIPVTGKWI